ncbi:MAG: hypothetical protein EOM12_12050, partial [Verrucomicrobiae bacterium]|nr:hypothetical protein [Verrucomicrobiae bacterium]
MANILSKQILNYFATFTETRFNFKRLINYRWTNNELTLDISLFPNFQNELLDRIKTGQLDSISIKRGEYALKLPKEFILEILSKRLSENFDIAYLETCISEFSVGHTSLQVDENGKAEPMQLNDSAINELAWKEGSRKFNIALRKEYESILIHLQEQTIANKKEELGIEHIPQSTFGITNYLQEHFDSWQALAKETQNKEEYLNNLKKHLETSIEDITLYDLFFNLQKYNDFANLGSVYVFFHVITQETNAFPLYYVEIELRPTQSEVLVIFPRDLLLINTPAINGFKFEQVLTTPRSCTFSHACSYLGAVETFLQSQYGKHTSFLTEPSFKRVVHDAEGRPTLNARIGLQTITNEDKKLLDYSEIMTRLDMGGESRFTDLVTQYIEGKIPNFQEEVARQYKEKYPAKSPQHYITNSPIPINDSQKRILLALTNEKNRLIVVDGPPGTGKSHTIKALTYWANEQNKSVVITSHKKEALDVIDRMLTDNFKALHPQSKPSIVRIDKETGSENNLQNTLQSAVINAANDRALHFNEEAVANDSVRVRTELEHLIQDRINNSSQTIEDIKTLVEYHCLLEELQKIPEAQPVLSGLPKRTGLTSAINTLSSAQESGVLLSLTNISLDEYKWIQTKRSQLGEFLDACEKINNVPDGALSIETTLTSIPEEYHGLLSELLKAFKTDVPLGELTTADGAGGFFSNLFGKGVTKEQKAVLLQKLHSLQHSSTVGEVAKAIGKTKETISLHELKEATEKILFKIGFSCYEAWLEEYRTLPGNTEKGIPEIYNTVRQHQKNNTAFDEHLASALEVLFDTYGVLLATVHITPNNLASLALSSNPTVKSIWRLLVLHSKLSDKTITNGLNTPLSAEYFTLEQKRVEQINDNRLKDLNNHLNELQRIKVSYEGGKRFTREETDILLKGISCVIAEPSTISKHFPMEEEMIDILIIDEASQVSIADSISLMLRAKQIVIFGDEYQYGAVSAVNVSSKYSTSYFSEIINAYQDDFNTQVSEEAKAELVAEVSKEIKVDEQQSDNYIKSGEIAPGTILWLKTFNIRTSTLSFAKAMANYTTSLKEHFRSFPEIISYSNEIFYKPAQLELIVNRIRTKPIDQTLQFIRVETKGQMAPNTNLDEVDAIIKDIEARLEAGFTGSIGIITSFKEQQSRMDTAIQERMDMPRLRQNHKLAIWFVGDVQGEERDIVYYSFVEDKKINNANLTNIYPVIGGTADNIRALKMQRLNVGFSRAKDTMVFVHSQEIEKYSNTQLGNALKHYQRVLEESKKNDMFIATEDVFDSPKERELYQLLLQTPFVQDNKDTVHIIPQFPIGKYLRAEFSAKLPEYRVDFLLTYTRNGKTDSLILEYDGLEYHFKNPHDVPNSLLSSEYIDYDIQRQLELESYGYRFLRINYFTLLPENKGEDKK